MRVTPIRTPITILNKLLEYRVTIYFVRKSTARRMTCKIATRVHIVGGRREFIRTGLGVAGGLALPAGFATKAFAADQPPIGTWPAGASGDSVFIGITVPRTGTYAVQGEDELKGYQLAIEHINAGHPLIKQISPKTTKGVLGKEAEVRRRRLRRQAERRGAGAAALHHREQGDPDDRLDVERGGGGAEQARPAREGAVRRRHLRLQRHHRQGLRALRRPPDLLRRDGGQRDRPGAA